MLIALIGAAASVLATLITGVLGVVVVIMSRRIRSIRDQVENDHGTDPDKTTNLREDMDEKHDTLVTMLRRDVGGIRQDIRQIRIDLSDTNGRVHDLETTQEKRNTP